MDTFGRMIGRRKQAYAVFGAMGIMFVFGLAVAYCAESSPTRRWPRSPATMPSQGNMEGKEVRFGVANSVLWAVTTTTPRAARSTRCTTASCRWAAWCRWSTSCWAEIIFGGVGAGLYGMLLHVILAVFIAGLMVGRTPEYLGKKIEAREVKLADLRPAGDHRRHLDLRRDRRGTPAGLAGLGNAGPHGLSEILYAFASADANNGSAFAGLNGNTLFYNVDPGRRRC